MVDPTTGVGGLRALGVEGVVRGPVARRPHVLLGLRHEAADIRLEVGIFGTVLGRDDEAKLVSVADRALEEFVAIGAVGFRAVELTRQSLARDPVALDVAHVRAGGRSEEHTSELQSLMRISYAVFCLKKKKTRKMKTIYQ